MRRLLPLVVLLVAGRLAAAPPERTHDITPADYASVNTITEIALSPDGKQVAYTLATWDVKGDKRTTDLWVVDTDGKGKPKQLTTDRANDRHPKWSADGKAIYVLANRKKDNDKKGVTRVWKIWLDGKMPPVSASADSPEPVIAFDYAPKTDQVFYTYDAVAKDKDDFSALRDKFPKIDYGHGKRTVSEMYMNNLDGVPEKVFADNRYIREFAVTADAKRIAMVTALDDSVIRSEGESRVDVWEAGKITTPPTDVYRAKAASPHAWLEGLAWNPDGTKYAFCAIFDAYPAEVVIGELKEGKWTTKLHERSPAMHVRGYGSPIKWRSNDVLTYLGEACGGGGFVAATADGRGLTTSYGQHQFIYAYEPLLAGAETEPEVKPVIAVVGSNEGFPNLYRVQTKGGFIANARLTDINPHTATWKFPTVEHTMWTSGKVEVGGPLELPYGWKKGDKPLPLVVAIHGGPTTASYNDLRFDPHNGRLYFAAKGYAVLCPNYRGSTGYGDKFLTDLVGNENDLDVKDIVSGIQHLIKEGIADPDRVAVMGWSNGGYLTNCLITMKNPPVKISAASSGAGILDTVAEWGFNDEPAYPVVFKKGAPWEQPDLYKKTSPTYGLGNVTTPTLIHVGANDVRCPPGHSRMLYRALKEYQKVPTQLCEYPGQPHGLGTLTFRTAKMEWDLAWFEKYLKK